MNSTDLTIDVTKSNKPTKGAKEAMDPFLHYLMLWQLQGGTWLIPLAKKAQSFNYIVE